MAELYFPHATGEVVPTLRSTVFLGHEDVRFAVGQISNGSHVIHGAEDLAYHRLRAGVYAKQTRMISEEHIAADGGEYDNDDARSIAIAVLENCGEIQRLVGSIRLIHRGDETLPVENFFPNLFAQHPAPSMSCEVSRYITRHEDRDKQNEISWALFQGGIAAAITYQMGPMFATIDPGLARIMRLRGIPITELATPTRVEEYNSTSLPVIIDIGLLAQRLEERTPGILTEMIAHPDKFTYFGDSVSHDGIVALGKTALNERE